MTGPADDTGQPADDSAQEAAMTTRPIRILALFATLAIAGCGGSATSAAPSVAVSEGPPVEAACAPTGDAGTVAVAIKDFEFTPATISAKVGDVIGFTNDGEKSHSATLDEGDCGTEILPAGGTGGLTFSKAGTYAFHCAVHASMTGTIEVQ
jgi:plastocyanin